jgi:hypothetical protein
MRRPDLLWGENSAVAGIYCLGPPRPWHVASPNFIGFLAMARGLLIDWAKVIG